MARTLVSRPLGRRLGIDTMIAGNDIGARRAW